MPLEKAQLSTLLKQKAREYGFDSAGIVSPDAIPQAPERLKHWLLEGYAADMFWMHERAEQRADPQILWPEVRSIIVLGVNYAPDHDPLLSLNTRENAAIAVYAQRKDYHDVIKKQLKQLAGWFAHHTGEAVKVFVDTAPVMEKTLAQAAGLGWQGKHSVLVSREFGNWLFLGAIYTTAHLLPDKAEIDHCGSCQKCLTICPTNAFPEPYVLDSKRCIAYLTIEHKGAIERDFRPLMGNRIFGCDDCLAICPWNKFAQTAQDNRLSLKPELHQMPLSTLVMLDDAAFRSLFAGTPVKRTGRERFIRNVLIAIGNSAHPEFIPQIIPLLGDPSALVRGACVWALSQLMEVDAYHALYRAYQHIEHDPDVIEEWHAALLPQRMLTLNAGDTQ